MEPTLNADDVRRLRKADGLMLECNRTGIVGQPFEAQIVLYDDRDRTRRWSATLPLATPQLVAYRLDLVLVERVAWTLSAAKFIPEVSTMLHQVRAGDMLRPHITVNNVTDRQAEAGFTVNELRIQVTRQQRHRPLVLTFLLDTEMPPMGTGYRGGNVNLRAVDRPLAAVA